jgi:hypothetical protein
LILSTNTRSSQTDMRPTLTVCGGAFYNHPPSCLMTAWSGLGPVVSACSLPHPFRDSAPTHRPERPSSARSRRHVTLALPSTTILLKASRLKACISDGKQTDPASQAATVLVHSYTIAAAVILTHSRTYPQQQVLGVVDTGSGNLRLDLALALVGDWVPPAKRPDHVHRGVPRIGPRVGLPCISTNGTSAARCGQVQCDASKALSGA